MSSPKTGVIPSHPAAAHRHSSGRHTCHIARRVTQVSPSPSPTTYHLPRPTAAPHQRLRPAPSHAMNDTAQDTRHQTQDAVCTKYQPTFLFLKDAIYRLRASTLQSSTACLPSSHPRCHPQPPPIRLHLHLALLESPWITISSHRTFGNPPCQPV